MASEGEAQAFDAIGVARPARYFAVLGADGAPAAWYHEAVHGFREAPVLRCIEPGNLRDLPQIVVEWQPNAECKIPPDAVAMSDAAWQQWVDAIARGPAAHAKT